MMLLMMLGLLVVGEKEVTGAIKVCLIIPGKKVEREEVFYGDGIPPIEIMKVMKLGKDVRVLVGSKDDVKVFVWLEIRRGKEWILGKRKEIEIRNRRWIRFTLGGEEFLPGDFILLRIVGDGFEKNVGFLYEEGWDDFISCE